MTVDLSPLNCILMFLFPHHRLALLELGENSSSSLNMLSVAADTETMTVEPSNIVALAKKALSASKQAASLAEGLELELDDSLSNRLVSVLSY